MSFSLQVVEPGRRAWKKIREKFGDEVFHEDGTLNRTKLGKIIFENAQKRQDLNRITHPEIFREMCWEIIYNFFRGKISRIQMAFLTPNQINDHLTFINEHLSSIYRALSSFIFMLRYRLPICDTRFASFV